MAAPLRPIKAISKNAIEYCVQGLDSCAAETAHPSLSTPLGWIKPHCFHIHVSTNKHTDTKLLIYAHTLQTCGQLHTKKPLNYTQTQTPTHTQGVTDKYYSWKIQAAISTGTYTNTYKVHAMLFTYKYTPSTGI